MSKSSLELSADALYKAAQRLGLNPVKLTNWGLLEVKVKDIKIYLFTSKTILNTQLASYLSMNKTATRVILEEHGFPNIPFCTPQTLADAEAFFDEYRSIVVKPNMGQRAQGIKLVISREDLKNIKLDGQILEKYIKGPELRYLVLEGSVIAVQQKVFEGEIYSPQGSKRVSFPVTEWNPELISISVKAASLLGLGFAAVDFKVDEDDKPLILEINSAPALWRFEKPDEGPAIPAAELLLKATIRKITSAL